MDKNSSQKSFYGLGIAPALLDVLEKLEFKSPTPIQEKAIPSAIEGKDLVGIAQTGTGKTLAFGIPMIQRLAQGKGMGLVVLPTRELAIQVDEVLQNIGKRLGLRTSILIGGAPMGPQMRSLSRKPHVIIATPGRLIDHLEQKTLHLNFMSIVVLDEADRMLDMGFAPQINKIFHALPKKEERQTMLFSATMPTEIMNMASSHMRLPIRVEIAPAGTTVEKVTQELFIVSKDKKTTLLIKLLETYKGSTLVFTRTKHGAKKVVRQLKTLNIKAAEIHSNRSLSQRREALEGFKSGRYRVLVATDIASRGIDVTGIELVINYDLPGTSDDYVHRIGRTARAGAEGHAITFAMPNEQHEVRGIERLIRKNIPISKHPDLPDTQMFEAASPAPQRNFHQKRRPRQFGYDPRPRRESSYGYGNRGGGFGGGDNRRRGSGGSGRSGSNRSGNRPQRSGF